ncbi:9135_t:CDS:2 [Paraglomus occultum]|uniref:9135_t:CDS:1 n=1 Tax=Paraglomus occultum TaxID=144539 RepID=A0A9N9FZT6_9GLOM|nr:9135_t:CDS:2 [Paraglomus occultum]
MCHGHGFVLVPQDAEKIDSISTAMNASKSETTDGIRGFQKVDTPNKVMIESISVLSRDLFDRKVESPPESHWIRSPSIPTSGKKKGREENRLFEEKKKKKKKEMSESVPGIPRDTLNRPSQDHFTAGEHW